MDISRIKKPSELPFAIPQSLESTINEMLSALERDDLNIDCYLDEVASDARCLPDNEDLWIHRYYANLGCLGELS